MKNNLRKFLLLSILILLSVAGFNLYKGLIKEELPVESLKLISKNVDIEIENFKVTHDGMGDKDWEIKAKQAQVNKKENKIKLTDVNVTLNMNESRQSTISADSGTINRETKDINLEGNVKFVAEADQFFSQFEKQTKKQAGTSPEKSEPKK